MDNVGRSKPITFAVGSPALTGGFMDNAVLAVLGRHGRALNKYLMIRLDEHDAISTQLVMILAWLFERIISSITILQSSDHSSDSKQDELDALHNDLDLLLESRQVIGCIKKYPNVFYSIIRNYANWKILIRVAKLAKDYEQLLKIYMNLRDYSAALLVLRTVKRADLFYLHGHLIMKHKPRELVDAFIEQRDIDPEKLLPILIQENPYHNKCCETIRYLEHCVKNLLTDSKVLHNNLFELYARYRDEETLIEFLEDEISAAEEQLNCPLDLQSCLRLCYKLKLVKTCVIIYSHMGLYDDAVELALGFDVQLAKDIARRVESEESQKRLWLSIAKNVLNEHADIELAAHMLDESKRLLKIEDVLIFFPDYKTVDQIRQALHQALEGKRNEIKIICDGAFETIAERIRSEIRTFKVRYSKLKCGQKCEICCNNIMSRSHYLFPCGHLFHYDCIIKEIMSIDPKYMRISEKLKQSATLDSAPAPTTSGQITKQLNSSNTRQQSLSLSSFSSQSKLAPFISSGSSSKNQQPGGSVPPAIDKKKIADELCEITSKECIYCGDFLANYIDQPAGLDSDYADDSI